MGNPWTPGPWSFYAPKSWFDGLGYIRPEPADGMEIAHHGDSKRSAAENEANARLIAAAPEMVEALADLVETLAYVQRVHGTQYNPPVLKNAQSLLARIRGETP